MSALALAGMATGAWGAERLLVVGEATWGGWDPDRAAVMVRDACEGDVFRYYGWLEADREFKFLTQAAWDHAEYRNASPDPYISGSGTLMACLGNANDQKFMVSRSGNYEIVCDLARMTVSVTLDEEHTTPVLHDVLYAVGSATPGGWTLSRALPLTLTGDDHWHFAGRLPMVPGIFKLATNCHGDYGGQKFLFRDPEDPGRLTEDGTDDRQWSISEPGIYEVSVDLAAGTIDIVADDAVSLLGAVTDWERDSRSLRVRCEHGMVELTPYNDMTVKVLTTYDAMPGTERESLSVCAQPECEFEVSETGDAIVLATPGLQVSVERAGGRVAFADNAGNLILREEEGMDNSMLPRRASFAGMGDRAFYGGGYNGRGTNLEGTTLVMDNTQTGGWDCTWSAPHNICIPFVVSASGYGLLFDDRYQGASLTPSAEGTTYLSGSLTPVAYYFVGSADGSMAGVMGNYTELTGRQPLPPYWALGYMTSRYGYRTQSEAEGIVEGIRDARLPLDCIVFDLYWQGEGNSGMGNLDWYRPNWPEPEQMMSAFAARGVRTVCITEPFFTSVSANYEPLCRLGYLADEDVHDMGWLGAPRTGLIDASNPAAMDWMWDFYSRRTAEGVTGWWLDLGEPERHDSDSRHAGGTVEQIHNEFGDLWTARVYRGMREDFPDVRPFLMPRAGSAGMQRYSVFPWTGDIRRSFNGLKAQVPALVSAGMSGLGYMGNDVGGFAADGVGTDPELYLRWIEMALFSPMMRTHSSLKPEPHLPEYAEVLPAVRDFLNMRYSYLPYTYTLAWENATTGMPLARPLNFHDNAGTLASPADSRDAYLWGRDILVAPVTDRGATSRSITFPAGKWVDLNDMSRVYAGGSTVTYTAPLETLPHFGRLGSFIARYSQSEYENTDLIDRSRVTVLCLVDAEAGGTVSSQMFDDDHLSPESLERGEWSLTTFRGKPADDGYAVSILNSGSYPGMPEVRVYTLVVPGYSGAIASVGDETAEYRRVDDPRDFEAAGEGAYMVDDESGVLYIRTAVSSAADREVRISTSDHNGVNMTADRGTVLEYCAGVLSYQLPAGAHDATLSVCDAAGRVVWSATAEPGDGTVRQVSVPASTVPGFYIATLSGRGAAGESLVRSVRMMVR